MALALSPMKYEVGALFTAARLIPLRKKSEGVRPIAIGEMFMRLVGKMSPQQSIWKCNQ